MNGHPARYPRLPVVGGRRSAPVAEGPYDVTNADDVFLSVASCWEMAIKVSLGRLTLPKPVDRFVSEHLGQNQFALLPVDLEHASRVAGLPFHHRDPFDRLLAAQALHEGLTLVSADLVFRKHKVKRAW